MRFAGEKWGLSHRNHVLLEAEQYSAVLPMLSWIYIGQWQIKFKYARDSSFGNTEPLSEERNACRALLSEMFGLGGGSDWRRLISREPPYYFSLSPNSHLAGFDGTMRKLAENLVKR